MKIIKQAAQLLDTTGMTEYQIIEKVGRTCYKSEDKITDDSATKFVASLVKSGHHAMIEFGFIYLRLTDLDFYKWFMMNKPDFIHSMTEYVVGSFRAFFDWFAGLLKPIDDGGWTFSHDDPMEEMFDLLDCLSKKYPEVFGALADEVFTEYIDDQYLSEEFDPDDIEWPFKLMNREDFFNSIPEPLKSTSMIKCITPHIAMFTTNRAVTHELVRHRLCSFAQESTRYCNYNKGKFGGELTIIAPAFPEGSAAYSVWLDSMNHAEQAYLTLINEHDATPQDARGVLPHDVKADIWVCAFEDEWQHMLDLRYHGYTGAPHPQIKEMFGLAYPQLVDASEGRLK